MLGQSNQSANLVAFCRTIGLNSKNPPKLRFKKFVKLTGEIAYISLTTFENEACTMTGNKNQVNLLKLAWKRILKLHQVNLLMASFIYLRPLCAGRGSKVCNGRTLLSCLYTLSYLPKISNCTCLICPSFRSAFRNALFQCHMCHWLIAKLDHAIFYRDVWFAGLGCCWIQTRIAISYCKVHISWEGH
jgi:hypothetical protein